MPGDCMNPSSVLLYGTCGTCENCIKQDKWASDVLESYAIYESTWGQALNHVMQQHYRATVKKHLQSQKGYEQKKIAFTVAFQPEFSETPEHCLRFMERLIRKTAFKSGGSYVLEQRSEGDNKAYGWHIHGIVHSTYAPSKVKQYMEETCDTLKIPYVKKSSVTFKVVEAYNDDYENNYMSGNKFNDTKDGKVLNDIKYRKLYKLSDVYEF